MKHFYLLAPVLAIFVFLGVWWLIKTNDRPIPRFVPPPKEDVYWDAEEYLRHLKQKPFTVRSVHMLLLKRTRQKPGVYLESLDPALDSAGIEIVNVYHQVLGDDYTPVITSGNDWPYHHRNSKHYQNRALDFRIQQIPMESRRKIVEMCGERLLPRFRVLWEKGEAEHLHVEMVDDGPEPARNGYLQQRNPTLGY